MSKTPPSDHPPPIIGDNPQRGVGALDKIKPKAPRPKGEPPAEPQKG